MLTCTAVAMEIVLHSHRKTTRSISLPGLLQDIPPSNFRTIRCTPQASPMHNHFQCRRLRSDPRSPHWGRPYIFVLSEGTFEPLKIIFHRHFFFSLPLFEICNFSSWWQFLPSQVPTHNPRKAGAFPFHHCFFSHTYT